MLDSSWLLALVKASNYIAMGKGFSKVRKSDKFGFERIQPPVLFSLRLKLIHCLDMKYQL